MLERAENFSTQAVVRPALLPRELRVPRTLRLGSAGLTIAGLLVFGSPADAAPCRGGVRFEASNYIDMYPINGLGRPGKIDRGIDVETGPAVNFRAEVLQNGKVLTSTQIISDGKLGRGEVSFTANCNTNQGSAMLVKIRTSQNPSDTEDKVILENQRLVHLLGREIRDKEAMASIAASRPDSDSRKKQILDHLRSAQITQPAPARALERPTASPVRPTETPKPTPFPAGTPASIEEARARVAATRTAAVPTPTSTKAPDFMATAQAEARMTPSAPSTPPPGKNLLFNIWNQIAKIASDHPILTGVGVATAVGLAIRPTKRHVYNFYRLPDRALRKLIAIPLHWARVPLWP